MFRRAIVNHIIMCYLLLQTLLFRWPRVCAESMRQEGQGMGKVAPVNVLSSVDETSSRTGKSRRGWTDVSGRLHRGGICWRKERLAFMPREHYLEMHIIAK